MSGQPPPPFGGPPRGWPHQRAHNPTSPSPSSFLYRPPSPWVPVAPSPPPIISGPRRRSLQSPAPMSPTPFGHAMSPVPQGSVGGLRGMRGPNNMPHPRPQWPQPHVAGNQSPAPYQPPPFQGSSYYQPPQASQHLPPKMCPSPTVYGGGGINGPRPFRPPQHQPPAPLHLQQQQMPYGVGTTSSFQLSPTPSPVVFQTSNADFLHQNNRHTPLSHTYETQQQKHHQQPLHQPQMQQYPRQHQYTTVAAGGVGGGSVPPEPPQPKSYVIYDDEEEFGPSTAEIIANQSQDYIDEKLAEYQMTILQLQGKFLQKYNNA